MSVVIPARDAAPLLERALAAVALQQISLPYEVVVVDDASTDGTRECAERAGARLVRLASPSGPARARNAGVAAASAPLLAFTDADCEPTPTWLAHGVAALEQADVVQGAVSPTPGLAAGPFDRTLRVEEDSPRLYESANLFMTREAFERTDGFVPFEAGVPGPDAGRPTPGLRPTAGVEHFGEDVWLGYRARRLGLRVTFRGEARVHHAVFSRTPREYVAEHWRLRFLPALVREVPELRESLVGGLFLTRRAAALDLALASLVFAARCGRRWPLTGALPYLVAVGRGGHPRGRVAADVVALTALARGSAAARALVL